MPDANDKTIQSKTTRDTGELNVRLDRLVASGRTRQADFAQMHRDSVRYVYGDQIQRRRRKKGWDYPVLNRMYADMMQEVAILSANNPRIETPPREDTDIETARVCGMVLQGLWAEVLNMRTKIIQALVDGHLAGHYIAKWYWDPRETWDDEKARATGDGWRGQIHLNIVNPQYFYCDPDVELASEIPTQARFIWTERWLDKEKAAQRWPAYRQYLLDRGELRQDTGEMVTPTAGTATNESQFNRSTNAWQGKESAALNDEQLQSRLADILVGRTQEGGSVGRQQAGNMVAVQEFFFRDYATEKVPAHTEPWPVGEGDAEHIFRLPNDPRFFDRDKPQKGDDGEIIGYDEFRGDWPRREVRPAYERPKYPHGRMVVRVGDEHTVVQDTAWPYDRWPFAVGCHYLLPHVWQGLNCAEMSRGYQDWLNTIGSHLTNYIKYFGDPSVWIEEGALAKDKKRKRGFISTAAGSVVTFAKGALRQGAARREPPPPLPSTLFHIFDIFKSADQDQKGVHDVAHGRTSKGSQTLGELDMLNRNTRQRVAMQGACLDVWLKQVALGLVELMQTHYEVGEWVRWTGTSEESMQSATEWTEDMASAKFDVVLEAVSTLPYDEEREVMKAKMVLEAMGPAALKLFLEKLKIQNIPDLLQQHELLGPTMALLKMAEEQGMGPEELTAAIKQQLQLLQSLEAEGDEMGGGMPPPGADVGPISGPEPGDIQAA